MKKFVSTLLLALPLTLIALTAKINMDFHRPIGETDPVLGIFKTPLICLKK